MSDQTNSSGYSSDDTYLTLASSVDRNTDTMSEQTNSSDYSSDVTYLSLASSAYDNNFGQDESLSFDQKSASDAKPCTLSTNNFSKQQDHELDVGNVYDRIHAHDDIKDFEKRKRNDGRPLPLPPPPQLPQYYPEKEVIPRRPCILCLVVGIGIILLASAAAVSIKLTCHNDLLCDDEQEKNVFLPSTFHPCDAQIQQNYSLGGSIMCTLELQNPKTFMLRSENAEPSTFALGESGNNVTMKGIVFTLERNLTEIKVTIKIHQVNCSNIGTYFVTVSNETVNETYSVNVMVNPLTQLCPCTGEVNVGKDAQITCNNVNKVNGTVVFQGKTSDDDLVFDISIDDIVENGGRLPLDSDDNIILVAETVSGKITFKLEFPMVKCHHAGSYAFTFGNTTFETVFTVKSIAKKPVIGVDHEERGGLVEGREGGQVRCEASVGCGERPTLWEYTDNGFQKSNSISTNKSSETGMTYYESVGMNIGTEQIFNDTQFKCNFTHDGNAYDSGNYTALVVPESMCVGANESCHHRHPFYCDKWIACRPNPVEQACIPGTHFMFNDDNCDGKCVFPAIARCTL